MVVGGACGSALTVTLPPGAVPVTAYAYVEYAGSTESTGAIQINGSSTSAGVIPGAPVTSNGHGLGSTWYSERYGVSPAQLSGGPYTL